MAKIDTKFKKWKESGTENQNLFTFVSDILKEDNDVCEFLLNLSHDDVDKILNIILNQILEFKSFRDIIDILINEKKITYLSDVFILKLTKIILKIRAEYIKEVQDNVFLMSYLRLGTYHKVEEISTSPKGQKTTIKEVEPDVSVLSDILEKNGIKLNNEQIKSIAGKIPEINLKISGWLNELKEKQ